MSVAVARVAEISVMIASLQGPPPPVTATPAATATTPADFAQALAGAQPVTATPSAAGTTPFGAEIDAAAKRNGIDPALLAGLVRQESGFDPNATSSAGAQGLTQLMPATARGLGVTNPMDPIQSLDGGARYLRQMLDRFGGDERLALAAYNAGPGAVARFGGVPPYAETQKYVERVAGYAAELRGQSAPTPSTI